MKKILMLAVSLMLAAPAYLSACECKDHKCDKGKKDCQCKECHKKDKAEKAKEVKKEEKK